MTRACGACTLCCRLLPVKEFGKKGGDRCQHQRHSAGCTIYPTRPLSCRVWSCRWLVEDDTQDQRRPDFSHVVIDMMPDYVTALDGITGQRRAVPVVQIWVDPRHPEAWRAKEVMAYIERRGADGFGAILRTGERDATVAFPPSLTGLDQWIINGSAMGEQAHSAADVTRVLGLKLSADRSPSP